MFLHSNLSHPLPSNPPKTRTARARTTQSVREGDVVQRGLINLNAQLRTEHIEKRVDVDDKNRTVCALMFECECKFACVRVCILLCVRLRLSGPRHQANQKPYLHAVQTFRRIRFPDAPPRKYLVTQNVFFRELYWSCNCSCTAVPVDARERQAGLAQRALLPARRRRLARLLIDALRVLDHAARPGRLASARQVSVCEASRVCAE